MKWPLRILAVLVLVVVILAIVVLAGARRTPNAVGLEIVPVAAPDGRIAVAIWYPTSANARPTTFVGGSLLSVARDGPVAGTGLPVVVFSHGNGGSATSHVDLALELASAGFVVATPTHGGDNIADQGASASPALFTRRAAELRATLDHLLQRWPGADRLDAARVGAFGMSAGAFTVLGLVGAKPDMDAIGEHCRRNPEFICTVLAAVGSPLLASADGAGTFVADPRIRAAVLVAPGLGFTFADGGLAEVAVPVQLWSGERDETVPYATNARIVEEGLGARVEAHRVAGASHVGFLAPCGVLRPPAICADGEGFDREAVHSAMNAEIIGFLDRHLRMAAPAP